MDATHIYTQAGVRAVLEGKCSAKYYCVQEGGEVSDLAPA